MMPLYDYMCWRCNREETLFRHVADRNDAPVCHDRPMLRALSKPSIFVARDICYDSPIDGRPITNKQARIEDLARSGCIEYDPGVKQDYQRRITRDEQDLDAKVDSFLEAEIEKMPTRKKERLASELESGIHPEYDRTTPSQESLKEVGND